MTIKTLTYIHNLLKEEEDKTKYTMKMIHELYYQAAQEDKPNAEHLREEYNKAKDKNWEARMALEDFEAKEW